MRTNTTANNENLTYRGNTLSRITILLFLFYCSINAISQIEKPDLTQKGLIEKYNTLDEINITSRYRMPADSVSIELKGKYDFTVNILNAAGDVTYSEKVTLGNESASLTKRITIKRDEDISTPTLLDNEFQVQVIGLSPESSLDESPIISVGEKLYKEFYLAQLISSIDGQFNDKFELIETSNEIATLSNTRANIYENEEVVFELKGSTKHIDLLSPQLAATGGYQAVVRFDAHKSNEGHSPKLEFFIADMNNNIITEIPSPTLTVDDREFMSKVVTLTIPSSIIIPHRLIIRCTADKNNPNVTCKLRKLRISCHDNIATNIQLSSCGENLNVSWDIINSDASIINKYIVQVLDESGTHWIAQSALIDGNNTTIPLNQECFSSRSYTVRVLTVGFGVINLGVSALNSFVYIKPGETLEVNTVSNIKLLLLGIQDSGVGALDKVAQMTTTNPTLSVNKVALQLKIKSGQYYFTSFPFQPDQLFVNCLEGLHRNNILIRRFDSQAYSSTPSNFNLSFPPIGDHTSTIPFSELQRGKGYLISVNKEVTGGNKGEDVFVTILGDVSTQSSRYINYNLLSLDIPGESITDDGSGNGYGYKGWSLLANPFPRAFSLTNNFYVSVYKIASLSSAGSNNDGKVAAAGYSVYRSIPGDVIPTFVPFFVQSNEATFSMQPTTIASSSANILSQELRLNLSDGNSYDEVILNLDEEASQFYTVGKDLVKMNPLGSGTPQISSKLGNESLVVRALTSDMAKEGVPVELFVGKSGKQTISIASSEWSDEFEYIIRNEDGDEFLLNDGTYEFDGVAGQTAKVTFIARTMPLSVKDAKTQKVVVSQVGDVIEISAPETIETIKLFNLNGSLVKSSNPMSETCTINSISKGAYIVEINMTTSYEVIKVLIQ